MQAQGQLWLRFEDLAQDGRLMLGALPASLTPLWHTVKARGRLWYAAGMAPIISRIRLTAGDGPFSMESPLEVDSRFTLAHTVDDAGAVQRIVFDADATLTGPLGHTTLPPPDDAGRVVPAGTVRVEHVFTRPFAPPGERRVTAIEEDGHRFVPEAQRAWAPPTATLEPPPDAEPLHEGFLADDAPLALGLAHTDANQHVNSLVYPRAFEAAALRALHRLGLSRDVLGRSIDVAYRRPSFSGDVLYAHARVLRRGQDIICLGGFTQAPDEPVDASRVFVQLVLR